MIEVTMQEFVLIIHILAVICLIILVLLQQGKGSDIGAAFGSGASNTVFGSTGSLSFFTKLTAIIALIFFITSVSLGVIVAKQAKQSAVIPQELSGDLASSLVEK